MVFDLSTVETLAGQAIALVLVLGSYFLAQSRRLENSNPASDQSRFRSGGVHGASS